VVDYSGATTGNDGSHVPLAGARRAKHGMRMGGLPEYWRMLWKGSQKITLDSSQVMHCLKQFLFFFTQSKHEPRFSPDFFIDLLN